MNKTAAPQTVFEGKYLRMVKRGSWEYVERTHASGLAAIILAVTPQDDVLFVEQFRVPLQAPTIEMPAGLVGDIDAQESIEISAIRELEEETGWTAAHAEVLMIGPTSLGPGPAKGTPSSAPPGCAASARAAAMATRTSPCTRSRAPTRPPGWCGKWPRAISWTPNSGPGCG